MMALIIHFKDSLPRDIETWSKEPRTSKKAPQSMIAPSTPTRRAAHYVILSMHKAAFFIFIFSQKTIFFCLKLSSRQQIRHRQHENQR